MTPEQYAVMNDKIIDQQVAVLEAAFQKSKAALLADLQPLLDKLVMDGDKVCSKCPENKEIVRKALILVRKHVRANRGLVIQAFKDGRRLINGNVKDYLTINGKA